MRRLIDNWQTRPALQSAVHAHQDTRRSLAVRHSSCSAFFFAAAAAAGRGLKQTLRYGRNIAPTRRAYIIEMVAAVVAVAAMVFDALLVVLTAVCWRAASLQPSIHCPIELTRNHPTVSYHRRLYKIINV